MDNEIILKTFAERFTSLIEQNNTDISFLAKHLGLKGLSTIYRYKKAAMAPKLTTIKIIAEFYNVNPIWLMGYNVSADIKDSTLNSIPLIKCNNTNNIFAPENIIGNIPYIVDDINNTYFAYIANDNLNSPLLEEGDIAIILKTSELINKNIFLLQVKKEKPVIAKIVEAIEGIDLYIISSNKPFKENIQKKDIKILGKVVKAQNESAFK